MGSEVNHGLKGATQAVALAILLAVAFAGADRPAAARPAAAGVPLGFVPNAGQTDPRVLYYARGPGSVTYFTAEQAVLQFAGSEGQGVALALRFIGAHPDLFPEARHRLGGSVSTFIGNDPNRWRTGLSRYREILYPDVWPGVDVIFKGNNGALKYELIVHPGASPDDIRLSFEGSDGISLDPDGGLLIRTALGTLRDEKPQSYQQIDGRREPVDSRFVLKGGGAFGFAVADEYDPAVPLIIDPDLEFSTHLGGSAADRVLDITAGAEGNAFVTGTVLSVDFPATLGAFQSAKDGGEDCLVAKLSIDGSDLEYATYIGGSALDRGIGIAVDASGAAYVVGETRSSDFPITPGAPDTTRVGTEAWACKLNPAGTALEYCTFLGGGATDIARTVVVDDAGRATIIGWTSSPDFPVTAGALDVTHAAVTDAFVARLTADGSSLIFATYVGGPGTDLGLGLALDVDGSSYVGIRTFSSTGMPVTPGAFDTTYNGAGDIFVLKLNPSGSAADYGTYYGAGGTERMFGHELAVDDSGQVIITGSTPSVSLPTTPGALSPVYVGGARDAFVAKFTADGSALVYATFLGGTDRDEGLAVAIDATGLTTVTGFTRSLDFPVTADAPQAAHGGGQDIFVATLAADGSVLVFSTFLGGSLDEISRGIGLDAAGNIFVAGRTSSPDYPTTAGAFAPTLAGLTDAIVARYGAAILPPTVSCELVPLDDGDEFLIVISVEDAIDPAPEIVAEINGFAVVNGQIVELELDSESEAELEDGVLEELEAPEIILTVTATNFTGASATSTCSLGPTGDDDDDDDDDDD